MMTWLIRIFLPLNIAMLELTLGGAAVDIDLTHLIAEGQDQGWPTLRKYNHTTLLNGTWEAIGLYGLLGEFFSPEHSGTHTDSPAHFGLGRRTVDQIPVSHLSGLGVVINITGKAVKDPDARLEVSDIKAWERRHGKIPKG